MLGAHVVGNVVGKNITGNFNRLVADNSAQGKNRNLGGSATDVNNHVPFGLKHINAYTDCSSHGLVNEVDLFGVGVLCRVAYGALFDFGNSAWNANHHPQRRSEPLVFKCRNAFNHFANHVLRGNEVRNNPVF